MPDSVDPVQSPAPEPASDQRVIWGTGRIVWIADDFDHATPGDFTGYV